MSGASKNTSALLTIRGFDCIISITGRREIPPAVKTIIGSKAISHNNKLTFISEKKDEKKKKRAGTAALILVFAIIIAAVGAAYARNGGNIAAFLGARETTTVSSAVTTTVESTETPAALPDLSILVICHDDEGRISFAYMLSALSGAQTVDITPLSPGQIITADSQSVSLSDYFAAKGVKNTVKALRDENGFTVDRYISVSEENFKDIIDIFGTVTLDVKQKLTVSEDGTNYTYRTGSQEMSSGTFLRYIKNVSSGDDTLEQQGLAHEAAFREYFGKFATGGEEYFDSVINLMQSDITAMDYAGYSDALAAFARTSPDFEVK